MSVQIHVNEGVRHGVCGDIVPSVPETMCQSTPLEAPAPQEIIARQAEPGLSVSWADHQVAAGSRQALFLR